MLGLVFILFAIANLVIAAVKMADPRHSTRSVLFSALVGLYCLGAFIYILMKS
jgi:hypothetical protein